MPSHSESLWQKYAITLQSFQRLWVGVSGGLDSMLLLHWLIHYRQYLPSIYVIHINHQLQTSATPWQNFVETTCQKHDDLCCIVEKVTIPLTGSLEAAAREARYQAFAKHMQSDDALVLAHHANDQAETLLMRILRGTGIYGLQAMQPVSAFGRHIENCAIVRPFLEISRSDLEQWAKAVDIQWVEDPTNAETLFVRNQMRHQLMPQLAHYSPQILKHLNHLSQSAQEATEILTDVAKIDLESILIDQNTMHLTVLKQLSYARQKNCLRYWLMALDIQLTFDQLENLYQTLVAAQVSDRYFEVGTKVFYRYQHHLILLSDHDKKPSDCSQTQLSWQKAEIGICEHWLAQQKIVMRYRQGGEYFHPLQRHKRQKLKKILQEQNIPVPERNIFLIGREIEGEIEWIWAEKLGFSQGIPLVQSGLIPVFSNKPQ